MTDFKIHHGNALDVLKTMESESVQCAITSPPYFGLRSYKTVPQVWGNHNGCNHAFGDDIPYAKQDKRTPEQKAAQGATVGNSVNSIGFAIGTSGNFCLSCNAWCGELGLEPTFQLYIAHLIEIFAEVKRVLKKDGICVVNLGDSYAGSWGNYIAPGSNSHKTQDKRRKDRYGTFKPASADRNGKVGVQPKSLMNIPHRFAIAMTDELQFVQRNECIWFKRACMPSSATDRFTVDFEPIFMFAKNGKYKFNQQLEAAVKGAAGSSFSNGKTAEHQLGRSSDKVRDQDPEIRNKRTVMNVPFEPSSDPHYASYPTKLVEPFILAGTDEGDTVLDIFCGTGTTLLTALRNKRKAIGIELNSEYIEISNRRLSEVQVKLF